MRTLYHATKEAQKYATQASEDYRVITWLIGFLVRKAFRLALLAWPVVGLAAMYFYYR